LKDIKPPQKGPWLFTLLDGAAYEAVEHFSLDDIAIEDGDRKVWDALHSRFPEKEPLDQMKFLARFSPFALLTVKLANSGQHG